MAERFRMTTGMSASKQVRFGSSRTNMRATGMSTVNALLDLQISLVTLPVFRLRQYADAKSFYRRLPASRVSRRCLLSAVATAEDL